jgi:hypothetical protein
MMSEIQLNTVNKEAACEQPGFLKRILWVFTSPGKLMASLAEKPRILFALILSAVSVVTLYLVHMPLYKDMLRASTLATSGYVESLTGQTMTPEMVEQGLPSSMTYGLISTPIMSLVMLLLTTVIFFVILKIMGGEGKFKAYLSVVGYSGVISSLYILLVLIIASFTGSLHIDPTLTSLATLVSRDSTGVVLYNVLKNIDIFSIWYYVVIAIGLATVSKVKKKYVYSAVCTVFLIGLIINVVGAVAASAIM